jgi:hypothetical protein
MYPNEFYYRPYGQQPEYLSSTFQPENYYNEIYDERQFGPMFPSQGPSMGPPPGPPGQGAQSGAPSGPPPSFVPAQSQQVGTFAVDPGSIRGCLFRYTYIWMRNRQQFWFYPTFVSRTSMSVSGWRWTGFSWMFSGVSLREIQSFTCV